MVVELPSFRFDGTTILDGIYLECSENEKVGIHGVNGSGKSTLFKTILGAYESCARISIDGDAYGGRRFHRIGYLPQDSFLPRHMTVRDCARLLLSRFEMKAGYLDLVSPYLDARIGRLASGLVRFIEVAIVSSMDRRVVIYDEPLTGLDPLHVDAVKRLLREPNRVHLISDHNFRDCIDSTDTDYILSGGSLHRCAKQDLVRYYTRS